MEEKLFSTYRLRVSTTTGIRTPKQEFESDRGRILFSAPFRRLQSKAQVFSLESNASVRSRLTHSIEVAHIGRYISQMLMKQADQHSDDKFSQQCAFIEPIVESACLLHDIGNPPFGHLGESAIQEWFKRNSEACYKAVYKREINKKNSYYSDFLAFDGNPQGARIVTTLQGAPGKSGYNLTYAQIAAIIKYPRFSNEENEDYKKIGAFTSEKASIQEIWGSLGLEWGQRHPLVYLMEAADDIAYSLSDIEDGLDKKIISEADVMSFLCEKFQGLGKQLQDCIPKSTEQTGVVSRFVSFRTSMINILVNHVAEYFYSHKDEITTSGIKAILDKGDDYSKAIKIVNEYCLKNIYQSQEAEDIELAGFNIVFGILDKFSILLKLDRDAIKKLVEQKKGGNLERRMFSKIPIGLVEHYKYATGIDEKNEWFYRFQMIVDHLSGMTDDYALKLYRLLNGIEVSLA